MKTSELSRACLQAYVDKESAAKALITTNFHFTSRIDNVPDCATYLARCWPNSESMRAATFVATADDGNRASDCARASPPAIAARPGRMLLAYRRMTLTREMNQ